MLSHDFYCTQCGIKGIPILRHKGYQRELGHLKKLFCINCNCETNHVETCDDTDYTTQDFYIEYAHCNFDKDGNRKMTYKELRRRIADNE